MPSSPACTVTSSPLSNSTSERLPVRSRIERLVAVDLLLGEHAERLRRVAERAAIRRTHTRTRAASVSTGKRLAPARRHRDVEIARIGGDAFHRPALAPEIAAHDPHARAVVVGDFGNVAAPDVLIARRGHLQRRTADWPTAGSRACGRARSPFGISWCRMPLPAVIHCTSPAPSVPRLPRLSPCSTVAGEHVGDGLDAAMRMPGEAGAGNRPGGRCGNRRAAGTDRTRWCRRSRTRGAASRRRLPWSAWT